MRPQIQINAEQCGLWNTASVLLHSCMCAAVGAQLYI